MPSFGDRNAKPSWGSSLECARLVALALGMNHPAPDGFIVAGVMLAGCARATLITYCWPQTHPPAITATPPGPAPDPAAARRATHLYAVLFTAAAGLGLALGYRLALVHVAWAAAAAMFIMRPDPGLLTSRAIGLCGISISARALWSALPLPGITGSLRRQANAGVAGDGGADCYP